MNEELWGALKPYFKEVFEVSEPLELPEGKDNNWNPIYTIAFCIEDNIIIRSKNKKQFFNPLTEEMWEIPRSSGDSLFVHGEDLYVKDYENLLAYNIKTGQGLGVPTREDRHMYINDIFILNGVLSSWDDTNVYDLTTGKAVLKSDFKFNKRIYLIDGKECLMNLKDDIIDAKTGEIIIKNKKIGQERWMINEDLYEIDKKLVSLNRHHNDTLVDIRTGKVVFEFPRLSANGIFEIDGKLTSFSRNHKSLIDIRTGETVVDYEEEVKGVYDCDKQFIRYPYEFGHFDTHGLVQLKTALDPKDNITKLEPGALVSIRYKENHFYDMLTGNTKAVIDGLTSSYKIGGRSVAFDFKEKLTGVDPETGKVLFTLPTKLGHISDMVGEKLLIKSEEGYRLISKMKDRAVYQVDQLKEIVEKYT